MSNLERITTLVREMPEQQLPEVIDFLMFLKYKNDLSLTSDLLQAGMSSTDFWNTPDDEVWDYV